MIRPFQIGDLLLVQRLGRYADTLNSVQSSIEPQSSFWSLLYSILAWNHAKVATHILRQEGHGLLGDGFLQTRKRDGRPESDILFLAPALVSDLGHPAIWEKLLNHYNRIAAGQKLERIYADVADQPLPVNTFYRAGYRVYARQTIWRLSAHRVDDYAQAISAPIRPMSEADRWALSRLYDQTVPKPVQLAEGATGATGGQTGAAPIARRTPAGHSTIYVLEGGKQEPEQIRGALQIVDGKRGIWFQLWADTNDPNPYVSHELLRYGLSVIYRWGSYKPVYIGVHDYQAGLNAVVADYEFAPVTDRARMVRHVAHWVREVQSVMTRALESVPQIAIAPFVTPESLLCHGMEWGRKTGADVAATSGELVRSEQVSSEQVQGDRYDPVKDGDSCMERPNRLSTLCDPSAHPHHGVQCSTPNWREGDSGSWSFRRKFGEHRQRFAITSMVAGTEVPKTCWLVNRAGR